MDLLKADNELDIYDKNWRIFTRNLNLPPQYISAHSLVKNSMINEGCVIYGDVLSSVLSPKVIIEEGAEVKNSVVLSNCHIKKGAKINKAVILENTVIEENTLIGQDDDGIYLVGNAAITKEA